MAWKPRAWSRAEAVLAGEHHGEAPARGRGPERGLRHAERDVARDRVAADGDRARACSGARPRRRSAGRSPGPRAGVLHAPAAAIGSCAGGRRGRGRGRARARHVDVDVDELRAQRAAEGRRQVAGAHAEDDVRARVVDLEALEVVGPGLEVVASSDRRSCPGRCRRRRDRRRRRSACRAPGRRPPCARRARSPPDGLVATVLSTQVPPVEREWSARRRRSRAAVVERVCDPKLVLGVRRRHGDVVAGHRRARHRHRVDDRGLVGRRGHVQRRRPCVWRT